MSATLYTIPSFIREYVKDKGYACPYDDMSEYIELWHSFFMAKGDFWDWDEYSNGVHLKMHRMSIHPAERVCNEWASLLLNEETTVNTEDDACNEWLDGFLNDIDFEMRGQESIMRAFALGTGAWDLSIDTETGELQLETYDARAIIPLSWNNSGITEIALCTKVNYKGEMYDQLKMHVLEDGAYHIITRFWDGEGNPVTVDDVIDDFDTRGELPWFSVVKPAIANVCADLSPYGQSVYASAIDVMKSVDMCYDAIFNEVDLAKMRIFISSLLVDYECDANAEENTRYKRALPFGNDNTIFRKVDSVQDEMITPYAPMMRTESQVRAYRTAVQTMGDLCGFGLDYFDIDDAGGLRTATEVSADNSAMMRNIRKHENVLRRAIAQMCRSALHAARTFLGETLPDEGAIDIQFDDSIITDVESDKRMALSEISTLGLDVLKVRYLVDYYGMTEEEAQAAIPERMVLDMGF